MPDTQKTTKAVREAKEASENTSKAQDDALNRIARYHGGGCAIVRAETAILVNAADGSRFRVGEDGVIDHIPSFDALYVAEGAVTADDLGLNKAQPRYTVELTTEGWQIKDNVREVFEASAYGSKRTAEEECDLANADSRRHD